MRPFKSVFAAMLTVATVAACGPSQEVQERLQRLETVSAEKDSLLQLVMENTQLMSEITAELARVDEVTMAGETPPHVSPDTILAKIRNLSDRVLQAQERLQRSERRIRRLASLSDSLQTQLVRYDSMLVTFRSTIDNQLATIETLTERAEVLETENMVLAQNNEALSDTLTMMAHETARAYYVIGTRDELKERGIIREEGGVGLIFTRLGETLVPADSLDPSEFTEIDIRDISEIELPEKGEDYLIVSTQDLSGLATPARNGKVRDAVRITDPAEFWTPSRFLILVRS